MLLDISRKRSNKLTNRTKEEYLDYQSDNQNFGLSSNQYVINMIMINHIDKERV
jgi:hypothetical protein